MRGDKRLVFVLVLVLSMQLVIAGVELGNISHKIDKSYTSSEALRGWINISIDNVKSDSLITAFNSNITLKEFLDKNMADYSCYPLDCKPTYTTLNELLTSKSYALQSISSTLFGLKLTEPVTGISNFQMNILTDADDSCINPLKIDLLDDNTIDWQVTEISDEECPISEPYGCYKSSDRESSVNVGLNRLCEEINLPAASGYKIGANIKRIDGAVGHAVFSLTLDIGEGEACTITTNELEPTINCKIELAEPYIGGNGTVCVVANANSQNKYTIDFEDNETCGYVLDENDVRLGDHDYEVFAKPLKYKAPSSINISPEIFDESVNINGLINAYLQAKYSGNCSSESSCIVPIRIFSGTDQDVDVTEILIDYDTGGQNPLGSDTSGFYDLESAASLISSEFLNLDLLEGNFLTPETFGRKNLVIDIAGTTISEKINITRVPKIIRLHPKEVGLLVPTTFIVFLDQPIVNSSNLTFSWDFGDGTVKTTKKNYVEYTYNQNKTYTLTINVSNNEGTTRKEFLIPVRATYEVINNTIMEYKKRIKIVKNSLIVYPDFVKDEINEIKNIDDLKSLINRIESEFKDAYTDEYVGILKRLNDLKVPTRLYVSFEIKSIEFIQNRDRFDSSNLAGFAALSMESSRSNEEYYDAINNWLSSNMDVFLSSKTYTFSYDQGDEDIFSNMIIEFKPKTNLDEFFMIIPGDDSKIKFKSSERDAERVIDAGYGLRLSNLESGKSYKIELIYPEKITPLNPPVYFSPDFRFLEFEAEAPSCNNDGKCDKKDGENTKNCRADCKPWKLTGLFLAVLFLVTFVIYILLQEWYKRNYENSLFKNKNQLFNLLTFMSNARRQGMTKSQIFAKLRTSGWSLEKLNYAWKKLNGQRTGMFEIPILKPFEKMKVKREIEKRKGYVTFGKPISPR